MSDEPLPVTDEDVMAAWNTFYDVPDYPPIPPDRTSSIDRKMLTRFRVTLLEDRRRVLARQQQLKLETGTHGEQDRET